MSDSQWLAVLARYGLVRASFIPPKDVRELRLVSRYRRKLTTMHSAQVNRLHKVLDDGSIKLGGVVSDINGVSGSAMVQGLIEGRNIASLLDIPDDGVAMAGLCECANAARMTKSSLASKYRSLMVLKSHKKSIVSLAHKMIRLIYGLLTRKQAYLDQQIDYAATSAKKNAPRWIKQLKRIGKWPAPRSASATASA